MKVRITNTRDTLWYKNHIGDTFDVLEWNVESGWLEVKELTDNKMHRYIRKEDCVTVLSESEKEALLDKNHIHWQQGKLGQCELWPAQRNVEEKKLQCQVVADQDSVAICECPTPEIALWISQRLNMAALLEQEKRRKAVNGCS